MDLRTHQHGRFMTGPYTGSWVYIEPDPSVTGWHIWVLQRRFGEQPNDGFDVWAEDDSEVEQWLTDPDFQISWEQ